MASVSKHVPVFNHGVPSAATPGGKAEGMVISGDSKYLAQGKWVDSFGFLGDTNGTSRVTVDPWIMEDPVCKNDLKHAHWAFGAGRGHELGPHLAWVGGDERLPSVGDTNIVLNTPTGFGHVGLFLRVPPPGIGLWVTVDRGQRSKPQQFAFIIGRWGVMSEHLPKDGNVDGIEKKGAKPYRGMTPKAGGPPFIAGNAPGTNHCDLPGAVPPKLDDDIEGMLRWIKFKGSKRRGEGVEPASASRLCRHREPGEDQL